MGAPPARHQDAAWFANISPLNHVDQVKVPVFVTHGTTDHVVDIEQSKRLVAELKAHHVPTSHGSSRTKAMACRDWRTE